MKVAEPIVINTAKKSSSFCFLLIRTNLHGIYSLFNSEIFLCESEKEIAKNDTFKWKSDAIIRETVSK